MFRLLVGLVKLSLLAKCLGRNTPLRKPNRGEGIISVKPGPKRAYDCVGLLYYFVVLLHDICVLPQPYVITFHRLIQTVLSKVGYHNFLGVGAQPPWFDSFCC